MQRQTVVAANFLSEQLLLFALAQQWSEALDRVCNQVGADAY